MLLLVFLPKVGGFNITVFPFTCLSACLLCILRVLRVLRDRSRMLFQNKVLQTYKLFSNHPTNQSKLFFSPNPY